jgi:hypothetical protein
LGEIEETRRNNSVALRIIKSDYEPMAASLFDLIRAIGIHCGYPLQNTDLKRKMQQMVRHEHAQTHENLVYYSYSLFEPFPQVSNIVSTRLGGVSEGYLRSLNLSFRVGDDEKAVITNRSRFYDVVGVESEAVASRINTLNCQGSARIAILICFIHIEQKRGKPRDLQD